MAQEQNNDALVNEYINVVIKRMNDVSLELVTSQAKNNLLAKEKEQLLKSIESNKEVIDNKQEEVNRLKIALDEEKNKEPVEVVKEVEIIKEVEVNNDKLNQKLIKELQHAERQIEKLKSQIKEIRDGGGTETEEIGDK